jgi:hypothetical protein
MENIGIFMTIWNILRPFGKFYGNLVLFALHNLVYISRFGMFGPRKIWQPCTHVHRYICNLEMQRRYYKKFLQR